MSFVDGLSSELPGYLVGLSPVTVDPVTGNYVTSSPFTGTVSFDSVMTLAAIPEPQTWWFFAIGLTVMAGWSRSWRGQGRRSDS